MIGANVYFLILAIFYIDIDVLAKKWDDKNVTL